MLNMMCLIGWSTNADENLGRRDPLSADCLRKEFGGVQTIQWKDGVDRKLVSNNFAILGGVDDTMILSDVLREIESYGEIWGIAPLMEEWVDGDKNQRLSWSHPTFIRFRFERGSK